MSYNFRILTRAQKEIYESGDWYEEKQTGLGYRFENEVIGKIRLIIKNPLHYPLKGKFREASLNSFPFLILYRIDEAKRTIVVLSVFHMKRHPKNK